MGCGQYGGRFEVKGGKEFQPKCLRFLSTFHLAHSTTPRPLGGELSERALFLGFGLAHTFRLIFLNSVKG